MNIVRRLYNAVIKSFNNISLVYILLFSFQLFLYSEDSIDYYSRSILIDSNDEEAFFSRAYAYFVKNDYDNAIRDFSFAIRRNSKEILSYFYRGRAYYYKKNYLNAMHDFSKVLTINPKHLKALFYIAKTKAKIKDYDGALSYIDKAIQLKPNMISALVFRAKIKTLLFDFNGALHDYEEALTIDPKNANTLNNYAWMLLNSSIEVNNPKKALMLAKDAVLRDNSNPTFLDTLACAYSDNNDFEKAIETGINAFKLKPSDEFRERINCFQNKISYSEFLKNKLSLEKDKKEKALAEKKKLNQLWQSIVSKNQEIIDKNKKISSNDKQNSIKND